MKTLNPPRLGHNLELDGLRGVAVLLVVAYHTLGNRIGTLSSGLDLFFVLSGFLITTLLLEEHDATTTVRLGDFFRRRALRLLPALYVYLLINVGMALAGQVGAPSLDGIWDLRTVAVEAAATVAYVYPAMLALWPHPSELRMPHLHSLAQEEWFYFFWAPVIARATRRGRLGRVIRITVAILAAITVARMLLILVADPGLVGPLRPDMMFVGAMVATGRRWWLAQPAETLAGQRPWVGGIALAGTVGFITTNAAGWLDGQRVTIAAVTGTRLTAVFPLIAVIALAAHHPLRRFLRVRWLRWYGRLSYGVYLWHVTVLLWANGGAKLIPDTARIEQNRPTWVFVAAALGGGSLMAWASYHVVEQPFVRMSRRYRASTGPLGPPT